MAETHKDGLTEDTKLIITVVLFFLVPWVGLIFMWVWMKRWPLWLKWVITAVVIIVPFVIAFMIAAGIVALILAGAAGGQQYYDQYPNQYPQQMMWEQNGQQMTPEDLQQMTPEQLQQMMMQNQDMMYQYGTPAAEPNMMQGQ